MDTEITCRVVAPNDKIARRALASAWAEMDLCARLLDRYRGPSEAYARGDAAARRDPAQAPSDVWRLNAEAGKWAIEVDPLTVTCLGVAREVWKMTDGAFDPTVGPLVDLWREAATRGTPPTDDEIAKARALVGMDKVEILVATVQKRPDEMPSLSPDAPPPTPAELTRMVSSAGLAAGMRLDLGGIAKGYAAGRMARRMQMAGATAGLVAAAGDIVGFGRRPESLVGPGGETRWGVAVQDPRHPEDSSNPAMHQHPYTAIRLEDRAVDTSGHYRRGVTIGGRRYSHILDPRTGRPVETRLASVTVVARDPATSDALSTAIAVLGVEKGLALVEATDGVECLILEWKPRPGQIEPPTGAPPENAELVAHRSKGFAAMEFKPTRD